MIRARLPSLFNLILIIASFVAFIVFAIAIPIFDLSNGISIE